MENRNRLKLEIPIFQMMERIQRRCIENRILVDNRNLLRLEILRDRGHCPMMDWNESGEDHGVCRLEMLIPWEEVKSIRRLTLEEDNLRRSWRM